MLYTMHHKDAHCGARTGILRIAHGTVPTPVFMPVGTEGSVKALRLEDLQSINVRIILANTYHLYLRPGIEVIKKFSGLHNFINWKGNILTDSGGYQVFSLAALRKVHDEGVEFRSHIDGSRHRLSPELAVTIQRSLNSDIQMVLDVCTEEGVSYAEAKTALDITSRWAKRARSCWGEISDGPATSGGSATPDGSAASGGYGGQLFGIVQGNFYEDLRLAAVEETLALDFPGHAIGGLSVGEEFGRFQHFLAFTAPLLPEEKVRYLMGIGTPQYILEAIEHGIDMFDCVFPTRMARNGTVFTRNGRMVLKNRRYTFDSRPIMEEGPIVNYSRSYLRHLFKAGEILGPMLASLHNLWFMKTLVDEAAQAIQEDRFLKFKESFMESYSMGIAD